MDHAINRTNSPVSVARTTASFKGGRRLGILAGVPVVVAALLASACSEAPLAEDSAATSEQAIRNGTVATSFVFGTTPMEGQAILSMRNKSNFPKCSGTLVHPQWVLSSKHCIYSKGETAVSIRPTETITRTIDDVQDHPTVDATLVHLSAPFADLPIILQYTGTTQSLMNQELTAWGYNATAQLSYGEHFPVFEVNLPYFRTHGNAAGQLIIPGDSGGATLLNGRQAGINATLDDDGVPGINASISIPEVRTWIAQTITETNVTLAADLSPSAAGAGWRIFGAGDFDGDGTSDLVWRRANDTGEAIIWLLNNDGSLKSSLPLPAADAGWRIYGVGDFNADGKADLVWRRTNDTSEARIWLHNGGGNITDMAVQGAAAADWRIYGVGDFDGDKMADLVWRRSNDTGEARIWLLNGSGGIKTDVGQSTVPAGWRIYGVGDFNGDGMSDLVWRRTDDTADAHVWLVKAGTAVADQGLPAAGAGWRIYGVGDFNGDGKDDLVWRRADDTGEAHVWLLDGDGTLIADRTLPAAGAGWRIYATGQFNGNGRSDLVWRRADDSGEARTWMLNSSP